MTLPYKNMVMWNQKRVVYRLLELFMEAAGKGVPGAVEREVSLEDISGKELYDINDMVRADSGGYGGCSACCRGTGSSIVLDPIDMFRLTESPGMTPEQFLSDPLEMNMVNGIILPNIRVTSRDEVCSSLNGEGRCGIHSYRPGFCRLFPLGRLYKNRSFSYFLQVHECPRNNRSKVKVRKWIDTPDVKLYEKFVNDWHYFLRDLEHGLKENGSLGIRRAVITYVLDQFYTTPHNNGEGFYPQFYRRITEAPEFATRSGVKASL